MVTEVGPGESLDGSMQKAFGDASEDEVVVVLTELVRSRDVDAETHARDVGVLLGALDEDDDAYGLGPRARLALTIHRHAEGAPEYEQWLTEHDREDDGESAIDFYQEQENEGSELFQQLDAVQERIRTAQQGG